MHTCVCMAITKILLPSTAFAMCTPRPTRLLLSKCPGSSCGSSGPSRPGRFHPAPAAPSAHGHGREGRRQCGSQEKGLARSRPEGNPGWCLFPVHHPKAGLPRQLQPSSRGSLHSLCGACPVPPVPTQYPQHLQCFGRSPEPLPVLRHPQALPWPLHGGHGHVSSCCDRTKPRCHLQQQEVTTAQ